MSTGVVSAVTGMHMFVLTAESVPIRTARTCSAIKCEVLSNETWPNILCRKSDKHSLGCHVCYVVCSLAR